MKNSTTAFNLSSSKQNELNVLKQFNLQINRITSQSIVKNSLKSIREKIEDSFMPNLYDIKFKLSEEDLQDELNW
jgi:hypothetical protein